MKKIIALVLVACSGFASANLVVDGDFSLDSASNYPGGFFKGGLTGSDINGWTVVGTGKQEVAGIGIGYLGAKNREIDLSGGTDVYVNGKGAGIEQTLQTTAGQQYSLDFNYYTGGGYNYPGGVDLYINGKLEASDLQSSSTNNSRSLYTGSFTGTGSDTIEFVSDHGIVSHVGNISVEAVPEPATLAVLGLGAVGLLRRRIK